jgi:cystathionine gamma-synthase
MPGACATAAAYQAQLPELSRRSWCCAACALLLCGSIAASTNASELARRLDEHPAVSRVRYPGLPGDPAHRTAAAQMNGFGAVLAFGVADAPQRTGSATPCKSSSTPPALAAWKGPSSGGASSPDKATCPGLVRLSAGCEHIDDLWNDLKSALEQASRPENPA